LIPYIQRLNEIPLKKRQKRLREFKLELVKRPFAPEFSNALTNYNVIVETGVKNANYDSTNDIDAFDLLWLCYEQCQKDPDFIVPLMLQLSDMSSGMCPQGRATRLFQLVLAIPNISV
jgi:hypothetical protein